MVLLHDAPWTNSPFDEFTGSRVKPVLSYVCDDDVDGGVGGGGFGADAEYGIRDSLPHYNPAGCPVPHCAVLVLSANTVLPLG